MEDLNKNQTIMFQTYTTADQSLKQSKDGQKTQEFPTFCYNLNNIKMIAAPNSQGSTVNLAQLSDDNKTIQYIAQPFHPSYGQSYALVNPMQLGQNGVANITVDGRQIVVNKPLSANTISNISFKCDVCGLMFAHLTMLNQHKRSHNQEDGHNDTATVVVTQQPNIIQAQNIISESGQNLGQIQIVATESLEPAQNQAIHHSNNEITMVQHQQQSTKADKNKCITCGGQISQNPKRKGPKLIRCENCIQGDTNNAQNMRPTQIFVSPDGDIKFEINDFLHDGQNVIQIQNQPQLPPPKASKKKNVTTTVTKCNTCNGTGVVIVENSATTTTTTKTNIIRSANTPQKSQIQHIQSASSPNHHQQQIQLTQQQQQQQQQQIQQPQQNIQIQQVHQVQVHQTQQQQHPSPAQVTQTNDKPFTCNVCGGKFSRYSSLWSHKKLHTGEKNYKCETCGIAFAKAVYLKNHMRIHTGEKPYRCSTCGMQFSQSPHLKNHERTHSGEKPYVCEVCDKGFARHATLWNHRRIHTGEKPYKCNRCQSAFSQAAHLKNHEKVHLGLKPFKCDICSGAFADRFALKRHRNIHEKYGQTAPLQSVVKNEGGEQFELIAKEEIEDEEVIEEISEMQ